MSTLRTAPAASMSADQVVDPDLGIVDVPRGRRRRPWVSTLRTTLAQRRTKIGLVIVALVLAVALFGPLAAPYSPTEFVGLPFAAPSTKALLGTDYLGRDVLTRVFYGGRSVFLLSISATILAMGLGVAAGMIAAYSRRRIDEVIMRLLDVLMAFPVIVFELLVISVAGATPQLIVLAVGIAYAPRIARVARGATLEVVDKDFVKASQALGVPRRRIILSEILPNVMSPLLVETGMRFAYSIAAIAALCFLGFGLQPPAADWGLMVNENRMGVVLQPYSVLMPIILISMVTVGVCLASDGLSRAVSGIDRETEI